MKMNNDAVWFFIIPVICGMAVVMDNAHAQIGMPEREHIQTIVWAVEFVAFVSAMALVWFIWHIGKRDSESRRRNRDRSSDGSDR